MCAMLMTIVLATAYALPHSTEEPIDKVGLSNEFKEFDQLMPYATIFDIFSVYAVEDSEFQNLIGYVRTEEFKSLFGALQHTPEAFELFEYLDRAGVDVYVELDRINSVLGIGKDKISVSYENSQITGGLSGFAVDIGRIIPFDEIDALHEKKMQSSEIYAAFIARITSPKFDKLLAAVEQNSIYGQLIDSAKRVGIDTLALKQIMCMLEGFREC